MDTNPIDMTLKLLIIADNDQVLRFGLHLILDQSTDVAIKEEAENGDELLKEIASSPYNILLLDLRMQGKDAVAMLEEVKSKWPQIPLVIYSTNPADFQSAKMLRTGAFAYPKAKANTGNMVSILRSMGNRKKLLFPYQADMLTDMLEYLENPVLIAPKLTIGWKPQNIIQPVSRQKKSTVRGLIPPMFNLFPFSPDHEFSLLNFN